MLFHKRRKNKEKFPSENPVSNYNVEHLNYQGLENSAMQFKILNYPMQNIQKNVNISPLSVIKPYDKNKILIFAEQVLTPIAGQ